MVSSGWCMILNHEKNPGIARVAGDGLRGLCAKLPDQLARVIGPQLQDSLGQPFVIETRPGAIGVIGTAEAARAAPDGHTILMTTNSTLAAAESLFRKLQYDPLRDFTPIALLSTTSMI